MDLIAGLGLDDLQEEYGQLFERYQQLQETHEADTQRIHELKRGLDTATAAEAYLAQELEQLTAPNEAQSDALQKTHADLEELRKKHNLLQTTLSTLQQDYDCLTDENAELRAQLKTLAASAGSEKVRPPEAPSNECADRLTLLECENLELLQKLEDFHEKSVQHTMAMAERERNVEILRDRLNCLEENMRFKRDELEEKSQLLESTQDQLAEANSKIAMLTSAPENNERKGNSLFAEVDDQRQAMKQLLGAQKKSYLHMKKVFNESEHEIRRLKRENIAMQTELQACSTIFCNAEKTYQDKLNERIRNLSNQNEELERKLNWTQERLKELADGKGVLWLESMFNFCKQETDDLKKQLHSVRIQKASLEEQLRHAQQDLARWRFESLKSRCVLLDRENLLNEHQISFKAVNDLEFKITDAVVQSARPRIVCAPRVTDAVMVVAVKSEPAADPSVAVNTSQPDYRPNDPPQATAKAEPPDENKENIKVDQSPEAVHRRLSPSQPQPVTLPLQAQSVLSENKKPTQLLAEGRHLKIKSFALETCVKEEPTTPPCASILAKKRDIFTTFPTKNVKFSDEEAVVHNISMDHFDPAPENDRVTPSVQVPPEEGQSHEPQDVKSSKTFYPLLRRAKSNVVVRRVVIGAAKTHFK